MQTFAPYADLTETFRCLDYRRLGKQRLETKQILKTLVIGELLAEKPQPFRYELLGISDVQYSRGHAGWLNHPAVQQWVGHLPALAHYHDLCIAEWIRRGYNNTMPLMIPISGVIMPRWWGDPRFHGSHRSMLLGKDQAHYSQFGWTETPNTGYFWPSQEADYRS